MCYQRDRGGSDGSRTNKKVERSKTRTPGIGMVAVPSEGKGGLCFDARSLAFSIGIRENTINSRAIYDSTTNYGGDVLHIDVFFSRKMCSMK